MEWEEELIFSLVTVRKEQFSMWQNFFDSYMKKTCLIEAVKINIGKNNNCVLWIEINLEKTLKDADPSSLQQKWQSRTRMLYSRS